MLNLVEFQTQLYTILSANLQVDVYDHRPYEPEYPYVRFNLSLTDTSTKSEINYQVNLDVLIFSVYPGNKELIQNLDIIKNVLTDENLTTINNQAVVLLDDSDIIDEGEELKAAVMNYRILLS